MTAAQVLNLEKLIAWRQIHIEKAIQAGEPMFLGLPEHWCENPLWRCLNGHLSRMLLGSEVLGDVCLACYEPVILTFPEDNENVVVSF